MSKKGSILTIVLAIILLLCFFIVSLYFIKFHGSLSDENINWATFGSYIAGISSFFNLLIFILITFYISRIEKNWRIKEIKFKKNTVIFEKTSEIFEEMILELAKLKTILILRFEYKQIDKDTMLENEQINNLFEFYDKLEFFENILSVYIPGILKSVSFKNAKKEFSLFLQSIKKNKESKIVNKHKKTLIQLIEKLTKEIGENISESYIE